MSSITEKSDEQIAPSRECAPLRMTFDEFLAWDGEATMSEWVDGEMMVMFPVVLKHQEINQFLITILGLYVQKNASGTILSAPFVMRFMNKRRGREPDLMFISRERAELIKKITLTARLIWLLRSFRLSQLNVTEWKSLLSTKPPEFVSIG